MRGALPREAQRDFFFKLKTSRFTPKSGSKGSNRVKPGAFRDRASFGRMARVTRRAALCTVPPFVSACLPSSVQRAYRVHCTEYTFVSSCLPVFSRVTPVYSGFSSQAHHGASPRPSVTAKTRGPIEGGLSRVKSNGEIDYLINWCLYLFFVF